jgi:CHAT domain/Concanavalin A-like lectin/glucanases superfamily
MRLDYLDFDLLIERSGGQSRARVLDSPVGQAIADFQLPFSSEKLEIFVLRAIGLGSRRTVRRIESPEMNEVKTFGESLFEAVFDGEVLSCLRRSLDEADRRGAGLRIRLRIDDAPEKRDVPLIDVPWEFLFDAAGMGFLCLSDASPLVRYPELPQRVKPMTVSPPLRVLAMVSSPRDLPLLDVVAEWTKLEEALGDLKQGGLVTVDKLEEATLEALHRRLRRNEYHVFHFIGHGAFDPAQYGVLALEDDSGRSQLVPGESLRVLFHNHRPLRLAVLNACEGARTSPTDPFAGVAQSLVQGGVSAVIAMQFEITDQAAIAFSSEFYTALADGYPVDAALTEARTAIFTRVSAMEWAIPVLYLRSPDGRIFDVEPLRERALEDGEQIVAKPLDRTVSKPPEERDRAAAGARLSVGIRPPTARSRRVGSFELHVDNDGDEGVTASVTATEPRSSLRIAIHPHTLVVGPGDSAAADVVAKPRRPLLSGRARELPFWVDVRTEHLKPSSVRGSFLQVPLIRPGALVGGVLAILLVAAALVFLWPSSPAERYTDAVLADRPVAFWSFDEDRDSSLALDSSEEGIHDGTYMGGVMPGVEGPMEGGTAARFDGENEWIRVPPLGLSGDYTIEAWVMLFEEVGTQDHIVGQEGCGENVNFHDGKLTLYHPPSLSECLNHEEGQYDLIVADYLMPKSTWIHWAVTKSGETLTIYRNGSVGPTETDTHRSRPFVIEAIGRGRDGYLRGDLAYVAVYDRALGPGEISDHYEAAG